VFVRTATACLHRSDRCRSFAANVYHLLPAALSTGWYPPFTTFTPARTWIDLYVTLLPHPTTAALLPAARCSYVAHIRRVCVEIFYRVTLPARTRTLRAPFATLRAFLRTFACRTTFATALPDFPLILHYCVYLRRCCVARGSFCRVLRCVYRSFLLPLRYVYARCRCDRFVFALPLPPRCRAIVAIVYALYFVCRIVTVCTTFCRVVPGAVTVRTYCCGCAYGSVATAITAAFHWLRYAFGLPFRVDVADRTLFAFCAFLRYVAVYCAAACRRCVCVFVLRYRLFTCRSLPLHHYRLPLRLLRSLFVALHHVRVTCRYVAWITLAHAFSPPLRSLFARSTVRVDFMRSFLFVACLPFYCHYALR